MAWHGMRSHRPLQVRNSSMAMGQRVVLCFICCVRSARTHIELKIHNVIVREAAIGKRAERNIRMLDIFFSPFDLTFFFGRHECSP